MLHRIIDIPKITDPRGNLAVIEKDCLPFGIQRVYYLYDVPSDSFRGGHAHKECLEVLVALSGSFSVRLDNGINQTEILLNKPDKALLIPRMSIIRCSINQIYYCFWGSVRSLDALI